MANTERSILEEIQRHYGGIFVKQPPRKKGWKCAYALVWSEGMVEGLLSVVGSHLRLKRKQAGVLLDFVRHIKSTPRRRQGDRGYFASHSNEVMHFRESIYQAMKRLNARGMSSSQ